ncbi:MAG TPA: amidohydrolase family protein [Candidatus Binataceae bacterium]|nr:amidohydrolase family protein [Candidatus Binataceae bacterium]
MASTVISKPIISADSHIMEPPETYIDRIDKKYKDTAPHVVWNDQRGDTYIVEGMKDTIPMGLIAAAGKTAQELAGAARMAKFSELHRGSWDPEARMADQDRDGVAAEVIYPSVGMILCNHPDPDYKKACFDAYNLWIADYSGAHPDRLIGLGQTPMRSPEEGIKDLERMKAQGLRGVMMSGFPVQEDYDSKIYDEFFEAAIELKMPLSFHILTSNEGVAKPPRGPKINSFMSIIRGNQDIIGTFIFGGVFERHPNLKIVCVEADAGWAPHFMYRMDHAFDRHRYWMTAGTLSKMPSEYFRENVYMTFQDDWVAFKLKDLCNPQRLMWANDFPHSDSTWPNSQALLEKHTTGLNAQEKDWLLHDNVAQLYGLN